METRMAQHDVHQNLRQCTASHRPFLAIRRVGGPSTAVLRRVQQTNRRSQICRCQAPDGGGGSLMSNFRAWASSTFRNNLRVGEKDGQGAPGIDGPDISTSLGANGAMPGVDKDQQGASGAHAGEAYHTSWDEWQQRFKLMDALRDEYDSYTAELEKAVAVGNYELAGKLKKEIDALEQQDVVESIMEAYDVAIEQQEFREALRLRDDGGAGLVGWWVASSEADPCGHLLQIVPDFGRYTGIMYKANELAEVKGYQEAVKDSPIMRGNGGLDMNPRDFQLSSIENAGHPVLEVFMAPREGGGWQQQPVIIPPPEGQGQMLTGVQFKVYSSASEMMDQSTIEMVGLSPDMQEQPDEEMRLNGATMGFIVEEGYVEGDQESDEADTTGAEDGESEGEDGDVEGRVYMGADFVAISVAPGQEGEWQEASVEDEDIARMLSEGGAIEVSQVSTPFDATLSSPSDIVREPASILRCDKDRFVLSVLKPLSEEIQEDEDVNVDEPSTQKVGGGRKRRGERGALGGKGLTLASKPGATNDIFKSLAKEVEKVHNKINPEHPMDIQRNVLARHLQEVTDTIFQAQNTALEGIVNYTRLPSGQPKTDPFSGLYLGAFGPHGHELLHLERKVENGEEMVVAVKLTGDRNVPAGKMSFRCKIGRKHRLPGHEYPPELGVVARYRGQGHVANPGYDKPRWVEGELLQFTGNSGVTRGAQLGFVWVVPKERRYLILLSRFDVDE